MDSTSQAGNRTAGLVENPDGLIASAPPTAQTAPPSKRATYLASLDAARVIGVMGVIWIHCTALVKTSLVPDAAVLGNFAVPFFVFTSVYLAANKSRKGNGPPIWQYALARARRLYLPFLAWTVIYLGMKKATGLFSHHYEYVQLHWDVLWNGGSYHLWFLPFIAVMSVAGYVFMTALPRERMPLLWIGIAALLGGVGLAFAPNPWLSTENYVLRFGLGATPAALWGFAVACMVSMPGGLAGSTLLLRKIGTVLSLCLFPQLIVGSIILLANLAGMGWALIGFSNVRGASIDRLAKLGKLAFGIYLVHIIPMGFIRSILAHLHRDTSLPYAVAAFMIVTLVSTAIIRLLLCCRITRWLVPE